MVFLKIPSIKSVKEIPENARIFIYGTGQATTVVLFFIERIRKDIKVLGFIDSFKNGVFAGKSVYAVNDFIEKFNEFDYDLILISSSYEKDIADTLTKAGVQKFACFKNSNMHLYFLLNESLFSKMRFRLYGFIVHLLSLFIKRQKDKVVIIGEYGGNFVGNSKYFYLYLLNSKSKDVYWLVSNKELYERLKGQVKTLFYPAIKSIYHLLTAEYFVLDNNDWPFKHSLFHFLKAKKIQLWHGVGFKFIERMRVSEFFSGAFTKDEEKKFERRYPKYDYVIATSSFYAEKVFAPGFGLELERVKVLGYPRNDVFYQNMEGEAIFSDERLLEELSSFKSKGYKIITHAPTFRDMTQNLDFSDIICPIADFLNQNKLIFVLKGHSMPNREYIFQNEKLYQNIRIYNNACDGYPLLKITDLLVTDYSSIYMDYLHTKRPILFFPYDYDSYVNEHRDMQFPYEDMTPGPKAKNINELLKWMKHFLVLKEDGYEEDRELMLKKAFVHQDGGSSERIFREIIEKRD